MHAWDEEHPVDWEGMKILERNRTTGKEEHSKPFESRRQKKEIPT